MMTLVIYIADSTAIHQATMAKNIQLSRAEWNDLPSHCCGFQQVSMGSLEGSNLAQREHDFGGSKR
jgi:hypothetical protein